MKPHDSDITHAWQSVESDGYVWVHARRRDGIVRSVRIGRRGEHRFAFFMRLPLHAAVRPKEPMPAPGAQYGTPIARRFRLDPRNLLR